MLKTNSVNLMKMVKVLNIVKIFITKCLHLVYSLKHVDFVTSYDKN